MEWKVLGSHLGSELWSPRWSVFSLPISLPIFPIPHSEVAQCYNVKPALSSESSGSVTSVSCVEKIQIYQQLLHPNQLSPRLSDVPVSQREEAVHGMA